MLESLKRKGDFHWHAHAGTFAFPMQLAVRFNIPLVIWGEPSSEYTGHYSYDDNEEVDAEIYLSSDYISELGLQELCSSIKKAKTNGLMILVKKIITQVIISP